jgi:hypothetical protein
VWVLCEVPVAFSASSTLNVGIRSAMDGDGMERIP